MSKRYDPNRKIIKKKLLRKYGKKCMLCGARINKHKLQLHHIVKWEKCKETTLENSGILCEKCHTRLHKAEKYQNKYYNWLNNQIRIFKFKKNIN